MGRIGRWISGKIRTYIVGVVESRYGYKVSEKLYGASGDDSPPLPGDRIAELKVDGAGNWVAVGVVVKSQGADAGEKILYSRDSAGVTKALLYLKNDGTFVFNGGTKETARKEDPTIINAVTDSVFITWIATISAAVNALASGSVPIVPTTATGKINGGTNEVLMP